MTSLWPDYHDVLETYDRLIEAEPTGYERAAPKRGQLPPGPTEREQAPTNQYKQLMLLEAELEDDLAKMTELQRRHEHLLAEVRRQRMRMLGLK